MEVKCISTYKGLSTGMLSTSRLLFCLNSTSTPGMDRVLEPSLTGRRIKKVINNKNKTNTYDGIRLARGDWLATELAFVFLVACTINWEVMTEAWGQEDEGLHDDG